MNYKNLGNYLAHVLGWGGVVAFIVYSSAEANTRMASDIVSYTTIAFLIAVFYLNYLVLIPRLEGVKQLVAYLLIIIGLAVIYYYIPRWIVPDPPRMHHPFHFPKRGHSPIHFGRIRLFIFLFVYIFSTSVGVLKLLFTYREKQQKAEHEKSKAELNLLKSQVNPHFLFNTLNSIYYLSAQKSDSAPEAVLQLSDIMRYTLTDTQSDFVTLEKELSFIEKYVELQKLRLSEKTKVDLTLPKDPQDVLIAPLLLITFIENAFKFGVSNHVESTISLKLQLTAGKELKAIFTNRVFENKEPGEQFGLVNARQRLEVLYPEKYKLQLMDTGDTYTVLLLINL